MNHNISKFFGFLILILISTDLVGQAKIDSYHTYGAYETAGVRFKMVDHNHDETAKIFYKKTDESTYKEGHHFVRFDGNHMVTSLFELEPATTYNIKIELFDPTSNHTDQATTTVTTQSEFSIPTAIQTTNVSNSSELSAAINSAKPGDHILLAAGDYTSPVNISSLNGTFAAPIVLKAADIDNKPKILNTISITESSYIYLDHLDVSTPADVTYGINITGSHHTAITNCYVHDCGGDISYSANIVIQYSDEADEKMGNHVIMGNLITEETPWDGTYSYNHFPGHTYYGIRMDYQPGGQTIIKDNVIWGMTDAIAPAGNENTTPAPELDDNDILDTWWNQELDIYDNVIYHLRDDGLEIDGKLMNCRIFRNSIGECANAVTTSVLYPGPVWVLRNRITGFREGAHKLNYGGAGETRNVYFYHNTIEKVEKGANCLYRGEPAHGQNIVFKNNILVANRSLDGGRARIIDSDIYTAGYYYKNQVFDYNLMWSVGAGTSDDIIFKYAEGPSADGLLKVYNDWEAFRDGTEKDFGIRQEKYGVWGKPNLNRTALIGYSEDQGIVSFELEAGSPAIDQGAVIPGINDEYQGNAPDIGAMESAYSAQGVQVITISPILSKTVDSPPFDVEASVSSNLPLTYSITGPAAISGTKVTLDGSPGTVTMTVSQAGNENYKAVKETVSFEVLKKSVLSVDEIEKLIIFPIPADDVLTLENYKKDTLRVEIFSLSGEIVLSEELVGKNQIYVGEIVPGTYLLKLTSADTVDIRKIIID